MAARVAPSDVTAIFSTSIGNTALTVHITSAHLIIEQYIGTAGWDEDLATELERWLAAHLACTQDPQIKNERIGDASQTFEGQFGLGLDLTRYGQQVKILDTTGTLAASLGKGKAVFIVNS